MASTSLRRRGNSFRALDCIQSISSDERRSHRVILSKKEERKGRTWGSGGGGRKTEEERRRRKEKFCDLFQSTRHFFYLFSFHLFNGPPCASPLRAGPKEAKKKRSRRASESQKNKEKKSLAFLHTLKITKTRKLSR
jgi:hypothetical protein